MTISPQRHASKKHPEAKPAKLIPISHLRKAIQSVDPRFKDYILRGHCEDGTLPAFRNPIVQNGWWYIRLTDIESYLQPRFSPQQTQHILVKLSLPTP